MDNQRTVDTRVALGRLAFGMLLLVALIGLIWLLFFHHSSLQTKSPTETAVSLQGNSKSTSTDASGAQNQTSNAQQPASSTGTNAGSAAGTTTKTGAGIGDGGNQTDQSTATAQLADTGPGETALFAAATVATLGTTGHFLLTRRRRLHA